MVLGIRLTAAVVMSALLVTVAGAQDRAEVAGEVMELVAEGKRCVLSVDGALYPTGIPAPCVFLRRGADAPPTVETFEGQGVVILVAGPPAHEDDYAAFDWLEPVENCSHIGMAIVLRGRLIELNGPRIEPLGFCPHIAPDQKFYYGIAYAN